MSVANQDMLQSIRNVFSEFSDELYSVFAKYLNSESEQLVNSAYLKLKKPYGINYILEITKNYGFSFAILNPGQSSSQHYHEKRKEFFVVRKGILNLFKNGQNNYIYAGQWNFSLPFLEHSISNPSTSEGLEIVEIFSPALLDDKIRVKDPYERKLGKVCHKE